MKTAVKDESMRCMTGTSENKSENETNKTDTGNDYIEFHF